MYLRAFYLTDWTPAGVRRERDARHLADRGMAAIWDLSDVVVFYAHARHKIEAEAKGLSSQERRALLDDLDDRYGVVPNLASDLWGYGVVTEDALVRGGCVEVEQVLIIFHKPESFARDEREERQARSLQNRFAMSHLESVRERDRVGHRLTPWELAQVATDELAAFGRCGRPTDTETAKLIDAWDKVHSA